MITQIEIDGFKTFKDFKVELAPFQVIVGPNGSGKSNLFDALQLLSRLAEFDLFTAFQGLRGDIDEMFTLYPDGRRSDNIKIAVEMLVDGKVQDDLGRKAELKYTRLRYEIVVSNGVDEYGLERLFVTHEALVSIPEQMDTWSKKYMASSFRKDSSVGATFISTATDFLSTNGIAQHNVNIPLITLHHDDQKVDPATQFQARDLHRTVLSTLLLLGAPHAFAVQQELRSLQFMHLYVETLRQSSPVKMLHASSAMTSEGGNLPTLLARMQAEDKFALSDVSLDMTNLVPDLVEIEIKKDDVRNEYTIWATYMDGRSFSSRVLSDGTLQLLVLATLKNDPRFHGILCFEEPENGIHPSYFTNIARLLKDIATDLKDAQQMGEPLRQVIITTHSPAFITQPHVVDTLLYMYTATRVGPQSSGISPFRITCAAPVLLPGEYTSQESENIDKQEASYTLAFVRDLLANDHAEETIKRLNQIRTELNKK